MILDARTLDPNTLDALDARPLDARVSAATWERVDPDLLTTLADEIVSVSALVASETRRLLALVARFDRLEGWKREGFSSCAEWLAYRTGLDKGAARERVRVARALAELPETDAAMSRGELSFSQVRALTRVASSDSEEELLEHARSMSASALERLVRSWKRLDRDDEAAREEARHAARTLSIFPDDDGSYVIRGRLDPEVGALLMRAVEAASDLLYRGSVPDTTPEQRRADALGLLAERALAASTPTGAGGAASGGDDSRSDGSADHGPIAEPSNLGRSDRYLVVLHVDPATLAGAGAANAGEDDGNAGHEPGRSHLEDGTRVSAETSRRLGCDATVVRVRDSEGGRVVDGAGRTRVVPPRMRRALELRDRGCRFPGCGSRFTDAHHVRHWADGGETTLENLVLLCRTHHRLLHEGGFQLRTDSGHHGEGHPGMAHPGAARPGAATFFTPTGIRIPEVPPPMRLDGRRVGGVDSQPHWETDVPLALYLNALAAVG